MKMSAGLRVFLSLLLFALAAPTLPVQIASGTITGIVTDPTGAVVPNAKVTVQNVATGVTRSSESNEVGAYTIPLLQPGTYTLTVEAGGFSNVVVEGVQVQVNVITRGDVALKVATATEQVTVQAAPVAVNADSPTLGEIIPSRTIAELPINGRNFLSLAGLSPGVVPSSQANDSLGNQVSISGVRYGSASYLFDGVSNKQDYWGGLTLQTPVDAIEEFKIQRGYFSAQFGLPAVINVVTKSGGNALHGAAWEFLKNQVLDARNFFDYGNPSRGIQPKPPYRYNQYGFSAGGPAIRNKLFWLGTYEAVKERRTSMSYGLVPTAAILDGDFSGQPLIYDPRTLKADPDNPGKFLREPFPGNRIPGDRVSDFSKKYRPFIPGPNTPLVFGVYNFANQGRTTTDGTKFDIRVDYKRSEANTFFTRVSSQNSDSASTSMRPFAGNLSPIRSRGPVVAWTHIFSPSLLNELRGGLDRVNSGLLLPEEGADSKDWPTFFGLRNLNQVGICNAVPVVLLGQYGSYGGLNSCTSVVNNNVAIYDNLIYHRGRHNITTGVEATRIQFQDIAATFHNGWLDFSGRFTGGPQATNAGNEVANYLLGAVNNVNGAQLMQPFDYRRLWWAAYVNDDFRMHKDFTLNFGLRYQYTPPPLEAKDQIVGFDFKGDGHLLIAGKDGNPRNFLSARKKDFAPRLGFAWVPFGRQNWSIRSSYGVFYDRLQGNEWIWQSLSPPLQASYSENSDPIRPTINIANLFPTFTPDVRGASLFQLLDRADPYLQQWTLSVQRVLPAALFIETAYVGSKGTRLSKRYDDNLDPAPPAAGDTRSVQERRPFPKWGFILADHGDATSSYNGLQLSLRKSFSHGLSFQTAYTWAHSIDMDSFDNKATRQYNPHDRDRTRSAFDIRERFIGNFVYELPLGGSLRGVPRQVVAGWELNGILTWQSGAPVSVYAPFDTSNTGSFWGPRPNRICDGNLPHGQRTTDRWFDTSCFTLPAQNTYGNAALHVLNRDGVHGLDLGIFKNFPIAERARVQFRSEFFNALNNTTFGGPVAGVNSPNIGRVSSAAGARSIQLALKLLW